MNYLVDSHLGGYYISDLPIDIIESYCEECGDYDNVILSFEPGNLYNELMRYFSKLIMEQDELIDDLIDGDSKEYIISSLVSDYDNNRMMISCLEYQHIITKEEKVNLLKQVSMTQKKQFNILRYIDIDGYEEKPKSMSLYKKYKFKKSSN